MDIKYMQAAIDKAKEAASKDEVPVGAVIVKDSNIIASAHNLKESKNCAVHHAEIEAVCQAAQLLGNWYLEDCEMYVTLEPCAMCAGALVNSRLKALYFGAYDPKAGCCGTLYNIPADKRFNHTLIVQGGIMEKECSELLSAFFRAKREQRG